MWLNCEGLQVRVTTYMGPKGEERNKKKEHLGKRAQEKAAKREAAKQVAAPHVIRDSRPQDEYTPASAGHAPRAAQRGKSRAGKRGFTHLDDSCQLAFSCALAGAPRHRDLLVIARALYHQGLHMGGVRQGWRRGRWE